MVSSVLLLAMATALEGGVGFVRLSWISRESESRVFSRVNRRPPPKTQNRKHRGQMTNRDVDGSLI